MGPDRGSTAPTVAAFRVQLIFVTSLGLLFTHVSVVAAGHCSFEGGICPDWVSTNCSKQACFEARKVADMRHGPTQDHTLRTGDGWCAYATTEQRGSGLSVAQLSSQVEGPFCFTGWYHQSGTEDGPVKFYAGRPPGMSKLFYATQRDMAGRWQRVWYSEKRAGKIEIMIRLHVERFPERGVFALDDLTVQSGECAPEPPNGSCDFDWGETCGYNLGKGNEIWQYAGVHRQPFHRADYSTNTHSGGLVYLHAKSNYTRAELTSPTLPGRKGPQCLQFYYYIDIDPNSPQQQYLLRVDVEGTRFPDVWKRSPKQLITGSWTAADMAFLGEQNFKIKFRCSITEDDYHHSLCAIDAIQLRSCNSNRVATKERPFRYQPFGAMKENFCDFENGWCTWSNRVAYLDNSPWILGGGTTKTTLPRPLQDHTFGNATGSYLFFSNFEQNQGNKAQLIGEILTWSLKMTQCVDFWYIISEDPEMNIQVQAIDKSDNSANGVPLWAQKGGRSLTWQQGRIAVPHKSRVIFVGTAGAASRPGYIALDDISIEHRDRCETLPQDGEALPATDLLSCSLAQWDFCHWSSTVVLQTTWSFGPRPSSSLAPVSLPENSKGNVAYLQGTSLNRDHVLVQLYSPMVGPQSEVACFSFWYHMFGARGVAMILMVVKSPPWSGMHTSSPLFFQRGRTTADIWYNVRRTVRLDSPHNKLVFDVARDHSSNKEVTLAMGPLKFTPGKCDILTDGRGYCDFEFDTCDWVVGNGWQRQQKTQPYFYFDLISGPANSVFMLTATLSKASGAVVTSPEWPGQKQPQCLEFWYLSTGKNAARLQVEVMVNGKSEVVWQQPPFAEIEWMLARTQILQKEKFKVVFRAKFLDIRAAPISLDDIVLRPEPCVHPIQCDFLDGLCGYANKFQGDFRWLVGTGRYETPQMQPAVPRETGLPAFAYLDLTTARLDVPRWFEYGQSAPAEAVGLVSPFFDAPDDGTQLSIQYYRNGPDITAANLSVSCYGSGSDPVNTTAQSYLELVQVSEWTTLNATLKPGTHCQLSVWVTRGDGTNGTMAIASVQVTRSQPAAVPKGDSDTPTRCTFEDGTMCGWRPGNFSLKWALNDPTKKNPDFPRFDHTLKAYRGHFAFAIHNTEDEPQHAILISPDLDVNATGGACLSFWVFVVHAKHVNLNVRLGADKLYGAIIRSNHRWDHVIVDFKRPEGKFKLMISFYMEPGLVAVDDIQIDSGPCPPRDFCSWEVGSLCLLIPGPHSFNAWQIRRASDIRLADHTTENLTGRYLYLNTTAVDSHHPVSQVFMQRRPPTEATCVTFWWSGHGTPGRLNVYRFTTETALRDPLVSVYSHRQDGQWLARTVTVTSTREWNLVFEGVAVAATKTESGIMVDDVEFTDGQCSQYESCSFEDECLPWTIPKSEVAFEVERAGSFDKLPRDHTMQTEEGHYLLFKNTGVKGNRTALILREPMRYQCISFWYYLPDLSDGVVLYVQDRPILKGTGVWKRYQVEHQTFWEDPIVAVSGLNPEGFIAIDDMFISKLACDETSSSTERFDCGNQTVTIERVCDFVVDCDNGADERDCGECDFSESLCGWHTNDKLNYGTMSWRRSAIGSVENSPPTGTDGRRHGYYLLLYSNRTRAVGTNGHSRMFSPVIRNTNKLCTLNFWYNYVLNGSKLGLDLYMDFDGDICPVWTLDALSEIPEEGTWNEAVVEIGRYPSDVSFFFASTQHSQSPVFAVDHITFSDCALPAKGGNCSDMDFSCTNGACVMKYERCNYVDDCGDSSDEQDCGDHRLSCSFESSFCDWVPQAPPDRSKSTWRLTRPSSSLLESPTRDHTTSTPEGHFIMYKSRSKVENATVIGPTLDNTSYCAMTFFYAMQGRSRPRLSLGIRSTRDGPWTTVWSQSRTSQFYHFVGVSAEFKSGAPYQVAFIGEHTTPEEHGYIAIDDVHFWESCKAKHEVLPASPVRTVPPFVCGENEFQCGGLSECIQNSKLCDFKTDCSNGADESRCGFCDFTTDLCGLENKDSSARYGWNWTRVQDGKKNKGFPTTDSRLSDQGAYAAYSLLNREAPEGTMTALVTPKMGQIAHSCVISFYAYVPPKRSAQLTFGLQHVPVNRTRRHAFRALATVAAAEASGKWVKLSVKTGNWNAGAQFVYLANTVGVSIDRPEYSMCHPDAQSEGWEAARRVTCDFSDYTECGWFPENLEDDTKWLLHTGSFRFPGLPWQPVDSASHKGAYMYAINTAPRIRIARVVSIRMSPTPDTGRCFTFWYNMWQPNVGTLKLLQRVDNSSTDPLWMRQGPQGKEWKQGRVQLYSEDPHQLVFEAVLNASTLGVIAIDNFALNDSLCDYEKHGVCDFESDACGWQLHNWERTTSKLVRLPTADYTTRSPSGNFALAKAPGGRMVSPEGWYDATQRKCLQFWFFISGTSAETLNVTRVLDENQQEPLWFGTTFDAPMKQWFSASVNLPAFNEAPTIVYEGSTSGNLDSAVAVDDISLGNLPCPSPGSCSFEEDMCNWFNVGNLNNARWYRHRGATVSNLTGIETDHTLGTKDGYYLLLDAEDMAATSLGSVQSQGLSLGPAVCLTLYYNIKQNSGASLSVGFLDERRHLDGQPTMVQATAPSQWTLFSVERADLPPLFTVVITGRTSDGRSDIAIDDIDVRRGKCEGAQLTSNAPVPATAASDNPAAAPVTEQMSSQQTVTTVSPPAPTSEVTRGPSTSQAPATPQLPATVECNRGQFNCHDGKTCISGSLLCDGVKDCPNELDEKCGSSAQCKENEFFCVTRSPSTCLARSLLCDGQEDCVGGSDESLCGACPPSFCLNGGTCRWTPLAQSPTCDCRHGYEGPRCQLTASSVAKESKVTEKATGSAGAIATGVIVVIAIIGIVIAVIVFRMRRRRITPNTPVFDNPSYNASTDETKLFSGQAT